MFCCFKPLPHIKHDELTNHIINRIGDNYLQKHGHACSIQPNSIFARHTNHDLARQLSNYHLSSSPEEKWYFLLSIYAALPKTRGQLSGEILYLLEETFQVEVLLVTTKVSLRQPLGALSEPRRPDEVANDWRKVVQERFHPNRGLNHKTKIAMTS